MIVCKCKNRSRDLKKTPSLIFRWYLAFVRIRGVREYFFALTESGPGANRRPMASNGRSYSPET